MARSSGWRCSCRRAAPNRTYASILFPPWLLSQIPKRRSWRRSHTTELAERWGRRVRNLISEQPIDPRHRPDRRQSGRRAMGAQRRAANTWRPGARPASPGFRALFGLIDDPIRSRQDADSLLVRDRLWDWYLNDFRPRLIPDARQVLIQTRWHEDDLAGRALNHQHWEVISLPAEAKAGRSAGPTGRRISVERRRLWLWRATR